MTSSGIQTATFRLVVQCLKLLRYRVVNCKKGIDISFLLCNRNINYPVHSVVPLPTLLLSMPLFHIVTFHFLRPILILSSHLHFFPPIHVFASGFPTQHLCAYFLCHSCHTVSPSRPRYNRVFRPPRHWLMVPSTFRKLLLYFKRGDSSSTFVHFKVRPSLSVESSVTTYLAT